MFDLDHKGIGKCGCRHRIKPGHGVQRRAHFDAWLCVGEAVARTIARCVRRPVDAQALRQAGKWAAHARPLCQRGDVTVAT
ncbi:hypothetical protein, partial [Xanthomonas oryzae]